MAAMLIGYAGCSTDNQDLTAQRDKRTALGAKANRIYVDHGRIDRNRDRDRECPKRWPPAAPETPS